MKISFYSSLALGLALIATGCSDEPKPNNQTPTENPGGYADPAGVLILNQGAGSDESSSLTYIAPDGTVQEKVYAAVNNSTLGYEAQDLYMYGGKLYILSNSTYDRPSDGSLVIADAVTLKKEKAFAFDQLKFPKPEGSLEKDEMLPLTTPPCNIAVVDENNVFLSDEQGLFRLNPATGEMKILKGSFAFGNQGMTIESIASTRGMTVVGDRVYCGGGGFWATTRLLEFAKDKDEVNRELELPNGDFISGVCQTGDHEILVATCGRLGSKKGYFYYVDLNSWTITDEHQIAADISAEFMPSSGISLAGDYIYFAAGSTTIKRVSTKTWKVEDVVDVTADAPDAKCLNCNVVANPTNNYIYVAVSDKYYENVIAHNYLLVYDCSGETPKLVSKIEGKTSYAVGIYPMSRFSSK